MSSPVMYVIICLYCSPSPWKSSHHVWNSLRLHSEQDTEGQRTFGWTRSSSDNVVLINLSDWCVWSAPVAKLKAACS